MGEVHLAVTVFSPGFATADLTENTQRHCEIYFLPLARCTAATAVTAMFCHFPDATPPHSTHHQCFYSYVTQFEFLTSSVTAALKIQLLQYAV